MQYLLTKDDRAPEAAAPTAQDYESLLVRARSRQLELSAENLTRLMTTYDSAAKQIVGRIAALPPATDRLPYLRAQLQLLSDIRTTLEGLARDYGQLLTASTLQLAQAAADREQEVALLVGAGSQPGLAATAQQAFVLSDGAEVVASFGTMARGAVEAAANRYYADGLKLSDRLGRLSDLSRRTVEDTLLTGLSAGTSARDLAKQMEGALLSDAGKMPRARAMLIAQTEINNAHREAAVMAASDGAGGVKPYVSGIGWRLSASHKLPDECDLYAADDTGLGTGNYLPGNVPVSHPRCRCYVAPILVEFPDMQFVRKEPDAGAVPRSEVERLARQGDVVAQRWLASGVGA